MTVKEQIIDLLKGVEREGIETLIAYLNDEGFFEAPCSTKYHSCFKGGLAKHSLRVYEILKADYSTLKLDIPTSPGQNPLPINGSNLIIAALLHDVCKIGAYIGTEKPYQWNKKQPKGHAVLSIKRIKKHIKLEEIEEMMILYHMGVYGCNEFYSEDDWQTGEYPLRGDHSNDKKMTREESKKARYGKSLGNAWYHNPIVKVIYFCDELATLEEKAESV